MTRENTLATDPDAERIEEVLDLSAEHVTKTPLFESKNSDRYQRQEMIKKIQANTGRSLVCYVSGVDRSIDTDDTMPFVDLLHNLGRGCNLDLLLHSTGGSADSAEKIITMVRGIVDPASFRIIVPEYAKSAGTVMVLGADRVVMSDTSELGPIDPQAPLVDRWQSVQNYLDAYDEHSRTLETEPGNKTAQIMLGKLDSTTVKLCQVAKERARQSAESLLRDGMFRKGGNYTHTVRQLLDTTSWPSHSQMISWRHALRLGLVVDYLPYQCKKWKDYWRLFCLQRLAVKKDEKLYESDYVHLVTPEG